MVGIIGATLLKITLNKIQNIMIVQLRVEDRYSLNIITYWWDEAHIAQILPSIDKEKLHQAIQNNTKYNETDYFIKLR